MHPAQTAAKNIPPQIPPSPTNFSFLVSGPS